MYLMTYRFRLTIIFLDYNRLRMKKLNAQKKVPTLTETEKNLATLVTRKGYLYTLLMVATHDLFLPVTDYADANWHDKLSYQEISFLFGLLVKNKIKLNEYPDPNNLQEDIDDTYKFLQDLHDHYTMSSFTKLFEETIRLRDSTGVVPEQPPMFSSSEAIVEAVFYDNSGAYDFQFWESSVSRYEMDAKWVIDKLGFSIEQAVNFSQEVKVLTERKKRDRNLAKEWTTLCDSVLELYSFQDSEFESIADQDTINKIINTFSISPGTCNEELVNPASPNILSYKPIIKLNDSGRFLLPVSFDLARAVDESPYYWMIADGLYKDIASKHRGEYAEKKAAEYMSKVFGSSNVHKDVKVSRSSSTTHTDIDVLTVIGNKAIVIQAKSKKLQLSSRLGDLDQLAIDFGKGIQVAYEQGVECRNHILARDAVFTDEHGNKISLEEKINEVYILLVTTDNHPALEIQVRTMLKKATTDPFPIAINMFDLDLLTKYLPDPYDFAYYLNQRVTLGDKIMSASEIACLGYHLQQKLYLDPSGRFDSQMIDQSFAQLIDDDIIRQRYGNEQQKKDAKIRNKWKNEKYTELISQIKSSNTPGFVDAAFYLLSLSSDSIDTLIEHMIKAKQKAVSNDRPYSMAMPTDNKSGGITYVVVKEGSDIRQLILDYSVARKYKSQANEWLGLGSYMTSENIIDCAVYNKSEWKKDDQLEEFSKRMIKPNSQIIKRKIGRNERCFCGSGLKYKKCHYLSEENIVR